MKCEHCHAEKSIVDIQNYVVKYHDWDAYNCCSEDCARKCANSDGIADDQIDEVE